MKKILTILFVIIAASLNAQSYKLSGTVPGQHIDFTVDNFDNIYLISKTGQVKKLNAATDSIAVFNELRKYGKATLLDVSNPMRALLYYRDYSTVILLDRLMNTRTTIDLRDAGVLQVKAIGLSYDNNVWVYDEIENKLKKISEEGRMISETPDLRQAIAEAISPQHIIDAEGMVYLYDSLKGLYAFDYYGTLKKKYSIPKWQSLRVIKKSILGVLNDSIYRYDMDTFVSRQHKLPSSISNARKIYFTGERIYALKNDALEIYTVQ